MDLDRRQFIQLGVVAGLDTLGCEQRRMASQGASSITLSMTVWGAYAYVVMQEPPMKESLHIGLIQPTANQNEKLRHEMFLRCDDGVIDTGGNMFYEGYLNLEGYKVGIESNGNEVLQLPRKSESKVGKPPNDDWNELGRLPLFKSACGCEERIATSAWNSRVHTELVLDKGTVRVIAPFVGAQSIVWQYQSDKGKTGKSFTASDRISYELPVRDRVVIIGLTKEGLTKEVVLKPKGNQTTVSVTVGPRKTGETRMPPRLEHFKLFWDLALPTTPMEERLFPVRLNQQAVITTPEPYCPPMFF